MAGPRCLIYKNPSPFLRSHPPIPREWRIGGWALSGGKPLPSDSEATQPIARGLPSGLLHPLPLSLGKGGTEGSLISLHIAAGFMN